MIHAFRAPGCQAAGLVIWKYNRFARDIDDAQFYKADLRRRGYTIHSLNDTVPEGLDGRLFEAAIDWMNARYLEDLATDIKRGQHHLVSQYGALGGLPPRGFIRQAIKLPPRRDGSAHTVHRWIPDPALIDRVQQAFAMRAAGASYLQINTAVRLYKSTAAYERFFSNEIYIGILRFGEHILPTYCDPIIDGQTWHEVQLVQERSKNAVRTSPDHPRRSQSAALLSGLAYCARCGSALNSDTVQFRTTAKYRYTYYTCGGRARHTCDLPKIPRPQLENIVLEQLAEIILSPDYLTALRNQRVLENAYSKKTRSEQRKRHLANLNAVRAKIRNLADLVAEPGSPRALLAKLAALEQDETAILTTLAELDKPLPPIPTEAALLKNAQNLRDLLADPANPAVPLILRGIITRITLDVSHPDKTILGSIDYIDPLNAYRPSYDDLYTSDFRPLTQCPRTVTDYTLKFTHPSV